MIFSVQRIKLALSKSALGLAAGFVHLSLGSTGARAPAGTSISYKTPSNFLLRIELRLHKAIGRDIARFTGRELAV
jgi:hypothetical protein